MMTRRMCISSRPITLIPAVYAKPNSTTNTLGYNLDIEQIYSHRLDDGERSFGLKRVREIVYQHPNMSHLTYKSGVLEGKEILVQQITIFEDGE